MAICRLLLCETFSELLLAFERQLSHQDNHDNMSYALLGDAALSNRDLPQKEELGSSDIGARRSFAEMCSC